MSEWQAVAQVVVIGLAAWRVASLFAVESGPFKIFTRLRTLLGFEHDPAGEPVAHPDTVLANLFACVWCLSLWTAILGYGVWQVLPEAVVVVAAAGTAVIAERAARCG
jgi:hypothetical protein